MQSFLAVCLSFDLESVRCRWTVTDLFYSSFFIFLFRFSGHDALVNIDVSLSIRPAPIISFVFRTLFPSNELARTAIAPLDKTVDSLDVSYERDSRD